MEASQDNLNNLTVPQLEALLAERRNRESRRLLRQIADHQDEKAVHGTLPPLAAHGLAGSPRKPVGGRATSLLLLPEDEDDFPVASAVSQRSLSAAALSGPERFQRSSLTAPILPRKQRGPRWLKNPSAKKAFDIGLLLAEIGFVVVLIYILAQWFFTDSEVSSDTTIAALAKPAATIRSTPLAAGAAITATLTAKITATNSPAVAAQAMQTASGMIAALPVAPSDTPAPTNSPTTTSSPTTTPTFTSAQVWGDTIQPGQIANPTATATATPPGGAPALTPVVDATDPFWGDAAQPEQFSPTSTVIEQAVATFTPELPTATAEIPTETPSATPEPPTATATPDPTLKQPIELQIPKIAVDVRVREVELKMSDDQSIWEVADYMAGHHSGSAEPGQQGNVVIAGHRDIRGSVFMNLDKLAQGDEIFVTTGAGVYRYVVRTTLIVRPDAVSVMAPTDDYRLTLITCTPVKIASHRLIIVADLDPGYVTPGRN